MADNWDDLDTETMEQKAVDDMKAKKLSIDKIYLDVYNTPEGKRMFEELSVRFVQTTIANVGDGIDQVMYRQGMCDVVKQMYKAVDDALSPDVSMDDLP